MWENCRDFSVKPLFLPFVRLQIYLFLVLFSERIPVKSLIHAQNVPTVVLLNVTLIVMSLTIMSEKEKGEVRTSGRKKFVFSTYDGNRENII